MGQKFIGSNFEAILGKQNSITKQSQLREKAFHSANYYLSKNTALKLASLFLLRVSMRYRLNAKLGSGRHYFRPLDGTTVAVTHFVPNQCRPAIWITPSTSGFCSAMDAPFPLANVWMHGHLQTTSSKIGEMVNLGGHVESLQAYRLLE